MGHGECRQAMRRVGFKSVSCDLPPCSSEICPRGAAWPGPGAARDGTVNTRVGLPHVQKVDDNAGSSAKTGP